jgi:murein DD-endopeptidase MepM/ murein hydrolase activator NlpD
MISVLQVDGTYAEYLHLRHGGTVVKPGDRVVAGQLIGYSGNTGWSSTPHIHFHVYVPIRATQT